VKFFEDQVASVFSLERNHFQKKLLLVFFCFKKWNGKKRNERAQMSVVRQR